VAQLISESRALLGTSRHVAVGAFHGLKETSELTRPEAKERVKDFLGRQAQEEPK
jgi:hypothetical protein